MFAVDSRQVFVSVCHAHLKLMIGNVISVIEITHFIKFIIATVSVRDSRNYNQYKEQIQYSKHYWLRQ